MRRQKMSKIGWLAGIICFLAGCGNGDYSSVEGRWVEPVPGMENQFQGFDLQKDGKAESINMATLVYERWETDGNDLILYGKSLGNGQVIAFHDRMKIAELTDNTLVLQSGEVRITYHRENPSKD